MANSSYTVQNLVDSASSLGDVAPTLATGGFSNQPALDICNDVISAMLLGGPDGQPFNWKWNRFQCPTFFTISNQQDYFIPGLVNLAWIEDCWCANINQTSIPKQKYEVEVKKDLPVSSDQTGYPTKICWIPNSQLQSGTWGAAPLGPTTAFPQGQINVSGANATGQQNPGPNVIYTNPLGTLSQPINASTCITDPNGNLWVVTSYGTCGATQPSWPTNPAFPTPQSPSTVATTVSDGGVIWTAINPSGQGFRFDPIPPQTGVVWQLQVVGQLRVPYFTTLGQTLEPVPDDFYTYFKQGFYAQCYRRNPDPKIRARFPDEWKIWLASLDKAVKQGDREQNDFGFVPGTSIMQNDWNYNPVSPAAPYGPY